MSLQYDSLLIQTSCWEQRDSEKTVELLACLWADCKNCPSAKGLLVALRNVVAAVSTLILTTGHMTMYNVKVVAGTADTAKEKFPLVLLVPLDIFGLSPSSLIGV